MSQPMVAAATMNDARRENRRAGAPGRHPFRRRSAGARQDDEIDAGKRQKAAQRDDDRLHAHPDHDQAEHNLVERRPPAST